MKRDRLIGNLLILLAACLVGAPPALAGLDEPVGTVIADLANVRAGPGTGYSIVGQAYKGDVYGITGRNQAGDWWQVCCINNKVGWIWGQLLVFEGLTDGVPVVVPPRPQPPTPTVFYGWKGEYYGNRDLQGSPAFVRDDPNINFRWGGASPGGNLAGTNFSVRWTRIVNMAAGNYQFSAQVDDGVRVRLDNWTVVDAWEEGSIRTRTGTFRSVGAGDHTITVEYYQGAGDAVVSVWWEQMGQFPEWKGEYFNDIYLQPPALLVRNDPAVNFNWDLGSPDSRIPHDNWSVRWTRQTYFESGHYDFFARTSDGVRLYLDGWRVIDQWHDTTEWVVYGGRFYDVGAGQHTVVVEYYERGGVAYAEVWWNKVQGGQVPQ
jgi:uncharacterized protein YraI